jgi:hypothetical protein
MVSKAALYDRPMKCLYLALSDRPAVTERPNYAMRGLRADPAAAERVLDRALQPKLALRRR